MTRTDLWRFLLILSFLPLGQSAIMCHRGMKLDKPGTDQEQCLPCQHGHFMPVELHTNTQCYPCTEILNQELEIIVFSCNRTHDAQVRCKGGYYRTHSSHPGDRGPCNKCSECRFPKRPCQTHSDAVCCPGDDYGVYINKDGHPKCVRECGPGQLLNLANDQCLPCPENSYMEENKHINNYCRDCEGPKSRKEVIVRPCNSTHPTVLGCIDGYYRQSVATTGSDRAECIKFCQKGQYLDLESETCQNCTENTYMDEDMHTGKCKQCDRPKSANEKIVQPCNRTHPAVIGCEEGFYRQLSDDLSTNTCVQCQKCSENKDENLYQGRACKPTRNTICCPIPDMDVVDTSDGPVCVLFNRTSIDVCGEGEYLYISPNTHSVTCLPCPDGTYMEESQHSNRSCKSCEHFPYMFCSADKPDHGSTKVSSVVGVSIAGLVIGCTIGLVLGIWLGIQPKIQRMCTWMTGLPYQQAYQQKKTNMHMHELQNLDPLDDQSLSECLIQSQNPVSDSSTAGDDSTHRKDTSSKVSKRDRFRQRHNRSAKKEGNNGTVEDMTPELSRKTI